MIYIIISLQVLLLIILVAFIKKSKQPKHPDFLKILDAELNLKEFLSEDLNLHSTVSRSNVLFAVQKNIQIAVDKCT